jgi:hypothetical protein
MQRVGLLLLAIALTVTACGGALEPAGGHDAVARDAEIYAAVVRRLVIGDNTFEPGTNPFGRVFIVDSAVEDANHPDIVSAQKPRPLTTELRTEMARRLADLGTVKFVESRESVLVNDGGMCGHVRDYGVVITLGWIDGDDDQVEVSNELYVACLAAQWQTNVVELVDGQWRVTGKTGPYAIS